MSAVLGILALVLVAVSVFSLGYYTHAIRESNRRLRAIRRMDTSQSPEYCRGFFEAFSWTAGRERFEP